MTGETYPVTIALGIDQLEQLSDLALSQGKSSADLAEEWTRGILSALSPAQGQPAPRQAGRDWWEVQEDGAAL